MGEYTGSISVQRPAAEVFAFLSDIRNMPRYLPTVQHVGPQGTHDGRDDVAIEGESHGRHYHGTGWLRVSPEQHRMEWGSEHLADYHGVIEVRDSPAGTEVRLALTMTPEPKVAEGMQREHGSVDTAMRLSVERTLGQMKAVIEAAGSGDKDTTRSADDLPDSRAFGQSATLNPDI